MTTSLRLAVDVFNRNRFQAIFSWGFYGWMAASGSDSTTGFAAWKTTLGLFLALPALQMVVGAITLVELRVLPIDPRDRWRALWLISVVGFSLSMFFNGAVFSVLRLAFGDGPDLMVLQRLALIALYTLLMNGLVLAGVQLAYGFGTAARWRRRLGVTLMCVVAALPFATHGRITLEWWRLSQVEVVVLSIAATIVLALWLVTWPALPPSLHMYQRAGRPWAPPPEDVIELSPAAAAQPVTPIRLPWRFKLQIAVAIATVVAVAVAAFVFVMLGAIGRERLSVAMVWFADAWNGENTRLHEAVGWVVVLAMFVSMGPSLKIGGTVRLLRSLPIPRWRLTVRYLTTPVVIGILAWLVVLVIVAVTSGRMPSRRLDVLFVFVAASIARIGVVSASMPFRLHFVSGPVIAVALGAALIVNLGPRRPPIPTTWPIALSCLAIVLSVVFLYRSLSNGTLHREYAMKG